MRRSAKGEGGWLIDRLGRDFSLLTFGNDDVGAVPSGVTDGARCRQRPRLAALRRRPGTTYLIRPDRYVAARWRT